MIWRTGNKKNNRKIRKGFQCIDWSIFLGPPFLKEIFIKIYSGTSRITSLTIVFGIKLSGHSFLGKRSLLILGAVVDSSRIEGAI
jgi:hypothetical protein